MKKPSLISALLVGGLMLAGCGAQDAKPADNTAATEEVATENTVDLTKEMAAYKAFALEQMDAFLTAFRKKSPILKECEGANSTNE